MTSVNDPNGDDTQCPTTTRRPPTVPNPAIQPSKRRVTVEDHPVPPDSNTSAPPVRHSTSTTLSARVVGAMGRRSRWRRCRAPRETTVLARIHNARHRPTEPKETL